MPAAALLGLRRSGDESSSREGDARMAGPMTPRLGVECGFAPAGPTAGAGLPGRVSPGNAAAPEAREGRSGESRGLSEGTGSTPANAWLSVWMAACWSWD